MLGKPRILSLFPNSFNKFSKPEHSCKILYSQKSTVNSEFFARILFSRIALKDICDVKNSGQGRDLLISVKRVISPIREDIIFTKLCICEVSRK